MARDLYEPWDLGEAGGGISVAAGHAQLARSGGPRGLVQKLAYKTDGVLVSQIEKLRPADLKEPPELVRDLTAFASSDDYRAYRHSQALFPAPGRIDVEKRWLAPHRVGFAEWWKREFVPRGEVRKGALEDRSARPANKEQARRVYEMQREAQRRENRRRSRIAKLEDRIAELEAREKELHRLVEEAYSSGADDGEADRLAKEFEEVRAELPRLLEEWETLAGE